MKNIKIYCLKDPRDLSIKYIGNTSREIYDRLKVHVYQSKMAKRPSKKEKWIKELLQLKLKPIAELIENIDDSVCVEREKYWIAFYNGLTNSSIGGNGGYTGCKHSDETIQFLRERIKTNSCYMSGKGRKWTEEQKALRRLKPAWNKGITGTFTHTNEWKENASIRMSGEKHPMHKLLDSEIISIRERHKKGERAIDLSREFKINYRHLMNILANKTRKSCLQS